MPTNGELSSFPQGRVPSRALGAGYALTVFVSAFLLFQIQPLISKYILPWFGGTPGVWTTCMLFFQLTLFAGYAYAHLAAARFPAWVQTAAHLTLLIVGLALLPIIPDAHWKPTGQEQPTWRIVCLLAASVGLPFFILSTTGPLLQHWFSRTHSGRSPYRLYALSNAGSLLALISYPFVFEPAFSTTHQAEIWSWGFAAFALLCVCCALGMAIGVSSRQKTSTQSSSTRTTENDSDIDPHVPSPTLSRHALWFALAMVPSVLLLAMTNQVCLDVASVPFLWVVPLSLYLLSFILCFDSDRWYSKRLYIPTSFVLVGCATAAMIVGAAVEIWLQALVHFSSLFACAMVCHGELAQLRPHPRHLTVFYLVISAGGAAGGLFVGVLAPAAFPLFLELHIGLIAFGLLSLYVVWRHYALHLKGGLIRKNSPWLIGAGVLLAGAGLVLAGFGLLMDSPYHMVPGFAMSGLAVAAIGASVAFIGVGVALIGIGQLLIGAGTLMCLAVIALIGALSYHVYYEISRAIFTSRNFYGVLRVLEKSKSILESTRYRELLHGRILHGMQFVEPESKRDLPTTYYGRTSGVGLILLDRPAEEPMRVGLVGLGAGTLATYARPGDEFRFYDINPEVVRFARDYFSYLKDCRGNVQIVLGDARLSLEREEPQQFDVLVLDAFSSDAIPVHLLTVESLEIYLKHLKQNGVLAIHISNRHFDLRPVVEALADYYDLQCAVLDDDGVEDQGTSLTSWAVVSREIEPLLGVVLRGAAPPQNRRVLWTDDYSNLYGVLRHRDPDAEAKSTKDKKQQPKPSEAKQEKPVAKPTDPQNPAPEQ